MWSLISATQYRQEFGTLYSSTHDFENWGVLNYILWAELFWRNIFVFAVYVRPHWKDIGKWKLRLPWMIIFIPTGFMAIYTAGHRGRRVTTANAVTRLRWPIVSLLCLIISKHDIIDNAFPETTRGRCSSCLVVSTVYMRLRHGYVIKLKSVCGMQLLIHCGLAKPPLKSRHVWVIASRFPWM